jgi:hypothetical protein
MLGMQRGNASFPLGSRGASATLNMELALSSPAGPKGGPTTLVPSPTATCCTAKALDFPGSGDQVLVHHSLPLHI